MVVSWSSDGNVLPLVALLLLESVRKKQGIKVRKGVSCET